MKKTNETLILTLVLLMALNPLPTFALAGVTGGIERVAPKVNKAVTRTRELAQKASSAASAQARKTLERIAGSMTAKEVFINNYSVDSSDGTSPLRPSTYTATNTPTADSGNSITTMIASQPLALCATAADLDSVWILTPAFSVFQVTNVSTAPTRTGAPVFNGGRGGGITISNNLSGGSPSPAFYYAAGVTFEYWNGTSLVNTGVATAALAVNPGGGVNSIFNLALAAGTVYKFDGVSNTLAVALGAGVISAGDIATDSADNFYLGTSAGTLTKYNSAGLLLQTYTQTGLPGIGASGLAIAGNKVYWLSPVNNTLYRGTLTGTNINYTAVLAFTTQILDLASCPLAGIPLGSPTLSIAKSNPSPILTSGVNSTYTITVTNTANAIATTARVLEALPVGLDYVSATGAGWTCTPSSGTSPVGTITCNFAGSIAATSGTSTIAVVVKPIFGTSGTTVSNKLSVDPSGGTSPPTPSTCTALNTPTAGCGAPVISTITAPNLSVAKTAPGSFTVGANSTYTITVTNTGNAIATTARVLEALPVGLDYVSATGAGWTCTPSSGTSPVGTITCNFAGSIAATSGTSTIAVVVKPIFGTSGTTVSNKLSVDPSGGTSPPTPSTCTALNTPTAGCGAIVTTPIVGTILNVAKSNPSPILTSGVNSTYTITVNNIGNLAATSATVAEAVPPGLNLVSATGTGWTCAPGSGTNPVGTINCTFAGSIAASGGTSTIAVVVKPQVIAVGTSVTNFYSVDPSGGTSPPTPNTCTAQNAPTAGCGLPVGPSPIIDGIRLQVQKSSPVPSPLIVGATSLYTITVTNIGTLPASNATVNDQIPTGLDFVSASGAGWTCVPASGTSPVGVVTCTYTGAIAAAGGTASALVLGVQPIAGTNGLNVTNFTSVDPSGGTTPPTPPSICTGLDVPLGCAPPVGPTPIGSSASLSVAKSTPSPSLAVGVTSAYSITVTNSGAAAATTATVSEAIPAGLDFVSATGAGWTCVPASGVSPVGTITCTFAGTITAAGGTSALTVNVKPIAASAGTSVTNYFSVDPSGGTTPPTPTACTAANTPTSGCGLPVGPSPIGNGVNLSVLKSTPSPSLSVGVNSAYSITVTNSGAAAATTATVSEAIPVGLDLVNTSGTGWVCVPASGSSPVGTITCTFAGTIAAAGGTSVLTINVKPIAGSGGTSATNYLSVDPVGGTTPPTPTTCTGINLPIAGCAPPVGPTPIGNDVNLNVSKSTPSPSLAVGVNSTYTITTTNSGTGAASGATVSEAIPIGLDFVSATGAGWTCVPASGTSPVGTITCTFGSSIATGGSSAFTITVKPIAGTGGTSVTNYLSVDPIGGTTPPDPTTCTAANSPTAGCAPPVGPSPIESGVLLNVSKSTPSPALAVGVTSTYTLIATNSGTGAASTAIISEAIPTELDFVSASGAGWTCAPTSGTSPVGTINCSFTGTIAPTGGTSTLTINVKATSATGGTSVTNKFSITPDGGPTPPPDPNTCTAANTPSAGCGNPVGPSPIASGINLTVSKSNPIPSLVVNALSTYTITVTDLGTENATSATVAEALPVGLSLVSASGTGWTCAPASGASPVGTINCTLAGTIAANGGTTTISVIVRPIAGTTGVSVTNKLSVDPTGGPTPPDPTTCTALNTPSPGCGNPVGPSPIGIGANLILVLTVNPGGIVQPGDTAVYQTTFTNNGGAPADNFILVLPVPTWTWFRVGSVSQNLGTTTLTVVVEYSSDGGATWTYTPVNGANGATALHDGNVTHVRWRGTTQNVVSNIPPNNTGSGTFSVRIK